MGKVSTVHNVFTKSIPKGGTSGPLSRLRISAKISFRKTVVTPTHIDVLEIKVWSLRGNRHRQSGNL